MPARFRGPLLALVLAGCASNATAPGTPPGGGGGAGGGGGGIGPTPVVSTLADPAGDTFGNRGPQYDLRSLILSRDSADITVILTFTSAPIPPTSGDPAAMLAFVDFDTDLDSTTGNATVADEFRRDSMTTGMGSDFQLNLADLAADSTAAVFDERGNVTGRVRPVYQGTMVTVVIPHALLGNDNGNLDAAVLVGSLASPTDLVPNQGHLELRVPAAAALAASSSRSHLFGDPQPSGTEWPSAPIASSGRSTRKS